MLIAIEGLACAPVTYEADVDQVSGALEVECAGRQDGSRMWDRPDKVVLDIAGDQNPAEAMHYGDHVCSGYDFVIFNARSYSPTEIRVGAGGWILDELSEQAYGTREDCESMRMAVDLAVYSDGLWLLLDSRNQHGAWSEDAQACYLNAYFVPGHWDRYSVAARVSKGSTTYPFWVSID